MLLNLKCIVLPLLALYTVNTVLSAWAAESRATEDGTSFAVGSASTIGTFEQHHHHRRWRRGSAPSFGSLGRSAFRSKSGRRVADEILPSDGTDNKSPSWFDNLKRSLKPASRLTHAEAIAKVRTHQRRYAFEVVLAQNVQQLHQRKEMLKATLFFEQTLNLFSNELVTQQANLQNGKDGLKQLIKQKSAKKAAESKNKSKGAKSEENKKQNKKKGVKSEEHKQPEPQSYGNMQKGLVGTLKDRITKIRAIKRKIKEIIDDFDMFENKEDFNFATSIYGWEFVRNHKELSEVLNDWEAKKPDDWGKNNLKIWMRNNTKSDDDEKAHALYNLAKANKNDTKTTNLVNQILLVDAAFDREARNLCLNAAFVVPMRNWAEISQKMTDEQIEEYVTNVLGDNFLGLQITFDSSIASTFDESADFEPVEESKKKSLLKTFKHNLRTAVRPYSSRGLETHLKQLEVKNTKLSWDILKAMSELERINAKESVKLAVYLMMLIEKAYSDEVTQKIEAAKNKVASQKREVKKAEKEHKRAHSRHNSPEHKMTRNKSVRSNKGQRRRKRDGKHDGNDYDNDGGNDDLGGNEAEPLDGDDDYQSGSFDDDDEEEGSDDDNFEQQANAKLEKCASKQKVEESRAKLAKSKSQHDELLKSKKAVKKSRESLYQLQKSKSGRGGFATHFDSIKTKAKGNEIYEEINGQIVENAKQELQLENGRDRQQVEKLVEKHMREVFAKGPGEQFWLNMIELSQQLTEAEIRRFVEKFKWFRGCNVQIDDDQIKQNGSGKRPPPVRREIISDSEDNNPRPQGLSRSASAASVASMASTQRSAGGSRLKSKSTKSRGKR